MSAWACECCGKPHDTLPHSFSWDKPVDYFAFGEEAKAAYVSLGKNFCHIGDEKHFMRCILRMPVKDAETELLFGVWIGVSKKNFYLYRDFLEDEHDDALPPPLYGALCGVLPDYDGDDVLWSEVRIHTVAKDRVPEVEVHQEDHPLRPLQQQGVSHEYWHEVVRKLMPGVAQNMGI